MHKHKLTREQFYALPFDLRQRWLIETQLDKFPPPPELWADVMRALQDKEQDDAM